MSGAPERVGLARAARAVLEAREGGRAVALVGRADEQGAGLRVLVYEDGETRGTLGSPGLDRAAREVGSELLRSSEDSAWTLEAPDGSVTLYAEVHRRPARLVIVGAGHIGLALARTAVLIGLPVSVLDDRDEFASDERFPEGVAVQRMDFGDPFADVVPGAADLVVLVTRAHKYDYDCLRALLDGDSVPRYIGMVGSRRRVRAAYRQLLESGVDRARVEGIYAPIGVEIGAETPEEIALSIAAEIVAVRRGVKARGSLRDQERILERLLPEEPAADGDRDGEHGMTGDPGRPE